MIVAVADQEEEKYSQGGHRQDVRQAPKVSQLVRQLGGEAQQHRGPARGGAQGGAARRDLGGGGAVGALLGLQPLGQEVFQLPCSSHRTSALCLLFAGEVTLYIFFSNLPKCFVHLI